MHTFFGLVLLKLILTENPWWGTWCEGFCQETSSFVSCGTNSNSCWSSRRPWKLHGTWGSKSLSQQNILKCLVWPFINQWTVYPTDNVLLWVWMDSVMPLGSCLHRKVSFSNIIWFRTEIPDVSTFRFGSILF